MGKGLLYTGDGALIMRVAPWPGIGALPATPTRRHATTPHDMKPSCEKVQNRLRNPGEK
jgi:hypothetical protein